jgi:hypothetical protein
MKTCFITLSDHVMYWFFKVCATPTLNVIIITLGVAAAPPNVIIFTFITLGVAAAPPNVIIITLSTFITLGVATNPLVI